MAAVASVRCPNRSVPPSCDETDDSGSGWTSRCQRETKLELVVCSDVRTPGAARSCVSLRSTTISRSKRWLISRVTRTPKPGPCCRSTDAVVSVLSSGAMGVVGGAALMYVFNHAAPRPKYQELALGLTTLLCVTKSGPPAGTAPKPPTGAHDPK